MQVSRPGRRALRGAPREGHKITLEGTGVQIWENAMPLAAHRTKITLVLTFAVLAALLAFALVGGPAAVQAQGGGQPPPGPVVYSGTITVRGQPRAGRPQGGDSVGEPRRREV